MKLFADASSTVGRPFDSAPLTPVGSVRATLQFDLTTGQFYANEDTVTQGIADSYTGGDTSRIVVQSVAVPPATARRRMTNAIDIAFAVLPTEAAIINNGGADGGEDEDAIALQESVAGVEPTTVVENINTQVGESIVTTVVTPEGGEPSVVAEPVFGESLGTSQLADKGSEDDEGFFSPLILMIGAAALAAATLVAIVAIVAGAAIIITIVVAKSKMASVDSASVAAPVVATGTVVEMGQRAPTVEDANPMVNAKRMAKIIRADQGDVVGINPRIPIQGDDVVVGMNPRCPIPTMG